MNTETTTYTVIGGDVLVLSTDPERVKFVTEALGARYDWAWWKAEAERMERRLNAEGESHRVTMSMLEALRQQYEEQLHDEIQPIQERLETARRAFRLILEGPPEIEVHWPEAPPVGPAVKEDPEHPQPIG